jgi:hypothetical protein
MEDLSSTWQDCFRRWPTDLERRGVVVTSFDEQIPFDNFAVSDRMLLVERKIPDTLGARKILIPFGQILAVKITDVVKMKAFQTLGFEDAGGKKSGVA